MMKKSNIEWCDFTWDPVTGCRNDCSFCESRKRLSHFKGDIRFHLSDERIHIDEERSLYVITTPLAKNGSSVPAPTGFYPTLHPYRLQQVIQKIKPANIWVCHSGDLFGEWIPTEWILQVFEAAKQAPWHNYMFLTMNPNRYEELLETGVLMPTDNFWYGTRLTERGNVFTADGYHTFLCIEPMRLFAERMEMYDGRDQNSCVPHRRGMRSTGFALWRRALQHDQGIRRVCKEIGTVVAACVSLSY